MNEGIIFGDAGGKGLLDWPKQFLRTKLPGIGKGTSNTAGVPLRFRN